MAFLETTFFLLKNLSFFPPPRSYTYFFQRFPLCLENLLRHCNHNSHHIFTLHYNSVSFQPSTSLFYLLSKPISLLFSSFIYIHGRLCVGGMGMHHGLGSTHTAFLNNVVKGYSSEFPPQLPSFNYVFNHSLNPPHCCFSWHLLRIKENEV